MQPSTTQGPSISIQSKQFHLSLISDTQALSATPKKERSKSLIPNKSIFIKKSHVNQSVDSTHSKNSRKGSSGTNSGNNSLNRTEARINNKSASRIANLKKGLSSDNKQTSIAGGFNNITEKIEEEDNHTNSSGGENNEEGDDKSKRIRMIQNANG